MQYLQNFLTTFNLQCHQNGASLALVHDELAWSYSELNGASDLIALDLIHQGTESRDTVALLCDRSLNTIAAMIGVLKAGATFVPIDPALPDERILYMIKDASVSVIIVDEENAEKLHQLNLPKQIKVKHIASGVGTTETSKLTAEKLISKLDAAPPDASDPAYVMYTSGSTGKPKGVVISHAALACYCKADSDVYELTAHDRTLQFSTLSFDISIEEIFPPLCVGSTVVLRPSARSDTQIELSDIIQRYDISAVHLATAYWHEWVDLMLASGAQVPSCLRLMVVTGEKVSPEHYYRWLSLVTSSVLWANAYGPTEATVSATVFIPPAGWKGSTLPIGRPLPGYSAYILDDRLQAVTQGETGQLYIGGDALSHGYMNRPELNSSVFLPDPFACSANARMYKTGDLARWLDDGNIDYAGRIDHQIKVGSYRVEPGEIENTINSHDDVSESVVIAQTINGKPQLVAYVACVSSTLSAKELADYLTNKLPAYMMPNQYLMMEAMPKTINGKIDRDTLLESEQAVVARHNDPVAPKGKIEKQLCLIWSDILAVPNISTDDSFINLGGDSLMAIRAIARIQKDMNFKISTRDFFFLDTIALLAGHMQGKQTPRRVPVPIPAFINSRHRQIYTVLQRPAPHNNNGRGILLVPPLGNEQRRVQRPFRNLMQNLSRQGYTLLRFDWHGTANSSGNTAYIDSLQPWIEDVQDAAEQLATHAHSVDIVALRLGALVAALTPSASLPITSRYYWDPVLSGESWLKDMECLQRDILNDTFRFLRPRKKTTGPVSEYAGLELNSNLVAELKNSSFVSSLKENKWNHWAQCMVPASFDTSALESLECNLHRLDEYTDWTDARATTHDMIINKGASQLATLLSERINPTTRYPLGRLSA